VTAAILPKRQRQVITGIAKGEPRKAIAARLGISMKTVDKHAATAASSLRIHDRVQLTHYCLHHRLVTNLYEV